MAYRDSMNRCRTNRGKFTKASACGRSGMSGLGSLEDGKQLTAREEADIGRANVWFMDWECDGWGPLPPAVERVMKASQGRRYTPTEARVILHSFYETAPGNF